MGCGAPAPVQEPRPVETPKTAPVTVKPLPGAERKAAPQSFETDLKRYRLLLALSDRKLPKDGSTPPRAVGVERAGLLFTLHRLTADEAQLDEALALVEAMFAANDNSIQIRRLRARALQKSHRFEDALSMIEKLEEPGDRAVKATLRFELGDYEASLTELKSLVDGKPLPDASIASRVATCAWKLGRFEEAETYQQLAMRAYKGADHWVRGWHHLLLGLMDLERGQLDDAMAHYQDAEKAYPGWWLIEEHIAEIHLEQGRPEQALPIYESVVKRTGNPELMAAQADTLDALHRGKEASALRELARQTLEKQLAKNPDAFGGHALEFFLEHGDPQRTLELARANVKLRPNGEAKLLLADALEKTGDAAAAETLRAEVKASGWFIPTH